VTLLDRRGRGLISVYDIQAFMPQAEYGERIARAFSRC
jgi:hypothetical protein